MKNCYDVGGFIRGKPVVEGNSPKNDIVDIPLSTGGKIKVSPGEVIVDNETLEKGPNAWNQFIMNQLKENKPDLYKRHFQSGGMVQPYTNDPTNMLYQENSSNPAPQAENIVKPINERIKQLESIKANLGPHYWTPKLEQEYNTLKAQQAPPQAAAQPMMPAQQVQPIQPTVPVQAAYVPPGFSEGGTVQKIDFQPHEDAAIDFQAAPAKEMSTKEKVIRSGLNALPTAGMIVGGALATPETLGLGTVGGAAAGAVAGNELKRMGEKYLLGDEPSSGMEHLKEAGEAAASGAMGEMGGQALGKAVEVAAPYVKAGAEKIGAKLGESLTGVPQKVIKTYAKHADEINEMAKSSEGNVAEAADQMRKEFSDSINRTRSSMNDQISKTLQNSNKSIDAGPVVKSIEEMKSKIDPDLYPEDRSQIDALLSKINKKVDPSGNMSVSTAHDVKQFLQDRASSSYRAPGDPASLGTSAAKAAKSGAAVIRKSINEAEPAVAQANNKLAELHEIDDSMNSNLITPGKPEAALMSAGAGTNLRNANALKNLGEKTDSNMLGQAEKLSAMRSFANPEYLPVDSTGKTGSRTGLGRTIGAGVGGAAGYMIGGKEGAMVGAAAGGYGGGLLSSPAALKAAIDYSKAAPGINKEAVKGLTKAIIQNNTAGEKPVGYQKWYADGLQNLKDHAESPDDKKMIDSMRKQLVNNPKGQQLLIEASTLKPGSKRLNRVLSDIRRMK